VDFRFTLWFSSSSSSSPGVVGHFSNETDLGSNLFEIGESGVTLVFAALVAGLFARSNSDPLLNLCERRFMKRAGDVKILFDVLEDGELGSDVVLSPSSCKLVPEGDLLGGGLKKPKSSSFGVTGGVDIVNDGSFVVICCWSI